MDLMLKWYVVWLAKGTYFNTASSNAAIASCQLATTLALTQHFVTMSITNHQLTAVEEVVGW